MIETEGRLASTCELRSDSAGAGTCPLAAVRIASRSPWLIGIEVRPMLSEAMLCLGIDQREADERALWRSVHRAADVRLVRATWQPRHCLGVLARASSRSPTAGRRTVLSSAVRPLAQKESGAGSEWG